MVEPGDRGGIDLQEEAVQRRDLLPVGVLVGRRGWRGRRRWRPRAGTRRPARVAAPPRPRRPRTRWRRRANGAVLVGQGHELAGFADRVARRASVSTIRACSPSTSGSSGMRSTSRAARRAGLVAEGPAHVGITGRRVVPFGEEEVDGGQHGGEPVRELMGRRHLERDGVVGEASLGAHEPLRHRRLGDEEQTGHLGGRQAAQRAQRQRHPALDREHRVARREHQAQEIVADHLRIGVVPAVEGGEATVGGQVLVVALGIATSRSITLWRAVVVIHAPGLPGSPVLGHCRGPPRPRLHPPRRGRGRPGHG